MNFTGGYGAGVEVDETVVKKIEDEGDFEEYIDEETGYTCRINRLQYMGSLCGYVLLPDIHPCINTYYDDIDVNVHGGLTFKGSFNSEGYNMPLHKGTWIGFDCNHAWDYSPRLGKFSDDGTYRDWEYVKNELRGLCKQLKALEGC